MISMLNEVFAPTNPAIKPAKGPHLFNSIFFETGAMRTPTKLQNPTNCGWGGSFQSYLTHS